MTDQVYSQKELDEAMARAKLEGRVEAMEGDLCAVKDALVALPERFDQAVTSVADSIRNEFRPMRKTVLGNGTPEIRSCLG